ncbi:hypothetical protein BDW22DRAFT_623844 [Trametopsis cervina]|nr:hypothetical protein BDW22DRAFT_623844 [Trametopsis cervina]
MAGRDESVYVIEGLILLTRCLDWISESENRSEPAPQRIHGAYVSGSPGSTVAPDPGSARHLIMHASFALHYMKARDAPNSPFLAFKTLQSQPRGERKPRSVSSPALAPHSMYLSLMIDAKNNKQCPRYSCERKRNDASPLVHEGVRKGAAAGARLTLSASHVHCRGCGVSLNGDEWSSLLTLSSSFT